VLFRSSYASNYQYRAWGGLKAVTDGSNHTSSALYNARLQPTQFDISGGVVHQNYDYYDDGRISFIHNTTDLNFDRSYFYDHAGRLTETKTGGMARNDYGQIPYHETFGYDAFSNLTERGTDDWNLADFYGDSAAYTNNRRVGWGYDADGRNTTIDTRTYTFDTVGRRTQMTAQQVLFNGNHVTTTENMGYDGDGAQVYDSASGVTTYYVKSSVLGGKIIEEINSSGQKNIGYVYAPNGRELAVQSSGAVTWKQMTPAGTTQLYTYSNTTAIGRTELDPLGANIPLDAPPSPPPAESEGDIGAGHIAGIMDSRWSDFFNQSSGCSVPGVAASCSGSMAVTNMDAEMRAFFGYHWYDLPGNGNEIAQEEERYESIYLPSFSGGLGYDPEFNRVIGSVTVTYSTGATRTLINQIGRAHV